MKRTNTALSLLALVLLGLAPLLLAQEGSAEPAKIPAVSPAKTPAANIAGLHLVMESEGLPGDIEASVDGEIKRSTQKVWAAKDRLLLTDAQSRLSYLFLAKGEDVDFWEISPRKDSYRAPRRHQQIQKLRDVFERRMLRTLEANFSGEALERQLKREYLRPDNAREVTLKGPIEEGKRLGMTTQRYQVHENGRLVVDAWVTQDLPQELPLFEFYRHVGAFSDDVLAKLKKIKGVPLEARLKVVTDTFNFKITAKVTEAAGMQLAPDLFELPKGAKLVEREAAVVPCEAHDCEAPVERAQPGKIFVWNGKKYYFCSTACRNRFSAWLEEMIERRSGDQGDGDQSDD